ncbi:MAG TPA: plastocyanin/azurin family copper-binding protein [Longimicrobiales bacterium]|nr:plastocyanin/azurin family copper-binding protein [Longimicrobiales bacterium]
MIGSVLMLTLAALPGPAKVPVLAAPVAAQSLLEHSPNLGGTWVGDPGVLHFHFLHRFQATDAPARKVLNTPTFLLSAGLPHRVSLGARYATNSLVRTGFPNEWELFGRWQAAAQERGAGLDVLAHAGWNQAAGSADGELTVARTLGRLRILAAARGFSDAYHQGSARAAFAGGATFALHEWVALAGDVATLVGVDGSEPAWSAGLQLRIPYSPHTLSLHASNANSTTLQGASRGVDAVLWGFEFTVPFTPARYFGRRSTPIAAAPADTGRIAAEVTMTDRLLFAPDTVTIQAGSAVRWTNTSVLPHTVTADPSRAAQAENVQLPDGAKPFDSGDMATGDVFVHTFTVPGTYRYVCIPHELAAMVGVVIVKP